MNNITDFNDYLNALQELIAINSTNSTPEDGAPFGLEISKCLKKALDIGKTLGFKTKNGDGYYGICDICVGAKETLGIFGHLDIVPFKEEDWKFPPLSMTIDNETVYGRGVVDDKGPILANLFAIRELISNGHKLKRNIRVVFGCDEETLSRCMLKFIEKEKIPNFSYTPDADFPCIHGEKTIIQITIEFGCPAYIKSLEGGQRENIVMDKVQGIIFNKSVEVIGKAAHGSKPQDGENAFIKLLKQYKNDEYLNNLLILLDSTDGSGLGINTHDDKMGDLTINIGIVKKVADKIQLSLDIRSPLSHNTDYIISTILTKLNATLISKKVHDGLFFDPESQLINTLTNAYNKITNSQQKSRVTGGGTYAKFIPNCVAFGPQLPGKKVTIHQANECIPIEDLKLIYKIYKEAIYQLAFQ